MVNLSIYQGLTHNDHDLMMISNDLNILGKSKLNQYSAVLLMPTQDFIVVPLEYNLFAFCC